MSITLKHFRIDPGGTLGILVAMLVMLASIQGTDLPSKESVTCKAEELQDLQDLNQEQDPSTSTGLTNEGLNQQKFSLGHTRPHKTRRKRLYLFKKNLWI